MRLAAQLYTVRDFTKTASEFESSLRKIKAIGYEFVQLSAIGCMTGENPEVSVDQCRKILDDVGIRAPLTHRNWDEIAHRTYECIEFHKTLGAELVAVGSIPPEYRTEGLDGYRRFADDAQAPIEALKTEGLSFAYHNHAFEFERLGPTGQRPFDVLVESSSEGFFFEIDTYWVVHAGMDLGQLLEKLSGRMPMVHLKDKAVVGSEARMAPIGEGNLDWPHLLPRFAEVGTNLCAVEQDDTYGEDPFDCLKRSYVYLQSLL